MQEKPLEASHFNPKITGKKNSPTPSIKRGKAEKLLKEHGSPPGLRVTAGGRIVPTSFTPLASPFQMHNRGVGLANFSSQRSAIKEPDFSGQGQTTQAEASTQVQTSEFSALWNSLPSANTGIPVFPPMAQYNNLWPQFAYYVSNPWPHPQYTGQFPGPYGYMNVPSVTQPTDTGPSGQGSLPALNVPETPIPNQTGSIVPIASKIVNLQAQYEKLAQEKLEFERNEIRLAPKISLANKQKNTDQKRTFVISLDNLRKSIKELRRHKEEGFTHCDSLTLAIFPNPNGINFANNQFNCDGAVPSVLPAESLIVEHNLVSNTEGYSIPSPGRRRSHAVEIKPPTEGLRVAPLKSALNPTSPSYEPFKPVAQISEMDRAIPKTPSPSASESVSRATTIHTMVQASSQQITDCSSSDSSVNTADFFPNNTAEHSLNRYSTSNPQEMEVSKANSFSLF
jgi:hypothetical protein